LSPVGSISTGTTVWCSTRSIPCCVLRPGSGFFAEAEGTRSKPSSISSAMELGRDCRRPPHSVLADGAHHHLTVVGLVDDEDGRSAPSSIPSVSPSCASPGLRTPRIRYRRNPSPSSASVSHRPLRRSRRRRNPVSCSTCLRHRPGGPRTPVPKGRCVPDADGGSATHAQPSCEPEPPHDSCRAHNGWVCANFDKSTAPEGVTRRTEKHLTARPRQPRRRWLSGSLHRCAVRSGRRAVTERQTHRRASTIRKKPFVLLRRPHRTPALSARDVLPVDSTDVVGDGRGE
jgi:hypothetical protein